MDVNMMAGITMLSYTSPIPPAIPPPANRIIFICCSVLFLQVSLFAGAVQLHGQTRAQQACPRPQTGSVVDEPKDVRSVNGILDLHLTAYDAPQGDGAIRYCMVDGEGRQSPNLRVHPGYLVILHLKNQYLVSGGTGQTSGTPDERIKTVDMPAVHPANNTRSMNAKKAEIHLDFGLRVSSPPFLLLE